MELRMRSRCGCVGLQTGANLKQNRDIYGKYGKLIRAWWTVVRVTFYDCLPDLATKTKKSVARYALALWEACGSITSRVSTVVEVVC
ncbi:hypothetical protein JG687_00016038 [Phytophthora cactorum]|uniref:Uncharacterized protein n=1 Tax=Phytophthora cactorum TaxID=29920 RepID=A0A8T1TTB5_9STRA|nr:hypothetical protein JG687_00016038 [Phytophthora cactorum]